MRRSVFLIAALLLVSAGVEAQPVRAWAAADTLFADYQDRFTFVPADAPTSDAAARFASATFEVEYVGFPPDARAAFQFAVDIWSRHLDSSVPIRVRAVWEPADSDDVLGATNPRVIANFERAPEREVWFAVALANARAGTDLERDEPHIRTSFNSEFDRWYFGTDGRPPSGQFDLVTIVLHELGHGLGFVGSMLVENQVGSWGIGELGFPIIYDRFAELEDGTSLLNETRFPNPSRALADALTSEDVFFDGEAATRAQGGTRPRLHAPPSWVNGSSYSHLSEQRVGGTEPYPPGTVNSLMTPTVSSAEAVHDPGPIVCGMFEDMGWPLAAACSTQVPVDPENPTQPAALAIDYDRFTNPIGERFGTATLTITANTAQRVDVLLFDTLGRRVATLFQRTVGEGMNESVTIDGRGLAAGVYFVWIESPDFFETRPVTVVH